MTLMHVHVEITTPFALGGRSKHYRYPVDGEAFDVRGHQVGVYEQPDGSWCAFEVTTGGRMISALTRDAALFAAKVAIAETPDFPAQIKNLRPVLEREETTAEHAHQCLRIRNKEPAT